MVCRYNAEQKTGALNREKTAIKAGFRKSPSLGHSARKKGSKQCKTTAALEL